MIRGASDRFSADGWVARALIWKSAFLVAAISAVYFNGLSGPFIFDDVPAIAENDAVREPTLRSVLGMGQPGGLTTSGRPILTLTLAVNHWLGGNAVAPYHVVNLCIHIAASLCLFGLVRRTLQLPVMAGRFERASVAIAFVVALLWGLHPLQTESVTYVVQRAESFAGFFYLLTLYAFARSTKSTSPGIWRALVVVACLLGTGTKEVVATVPVVLWCYDRAFVSGTFRDAWKRNRGLYLLLSGTWIILCLLVIGTGGRGGTAGFGTEISPWSYALTQCGAIVRYIWLSVWPGGLVFDYGLSVVRNVAEILPQAIAILGLLIGTVVALRRWPAVGFLGVWFFVLLAPSSSVLPIATQTMAEHRMYLPLAAILAGLVIALYLIVGSRSAYFWGVVATAWAVTTTARNADYRSEVVIWRDTVAKLPTNARAHNNLGRELFRLGDIRGSIARYEQALQLQPKYPETHYNLGVSLAASGDLEGAITHYERALQFDPDYPEAQNNLGNALVATGRTTEAISHYKRALEIRPAFAEAQNNLGNALFQLGGMPEAQRRFERALELRPDYPEANFNLGNLLAAAGDMRAALAHYERALKLNPGYAEALINAGNAYLALGDSVKAKNAYQRAIATAPNSAEAQFNLASVYLDAEQWKEALPRLETVVRLKPDHAPAHRALGFTLAKLGHLSKALSYYEQYVILAPNDREGRAELELLRGRVGGVRM